MKPTRIIKNFLTTILLTTICVSALLNAQEKVAVAPATVPSSEQARDLLFQQALSIFPEHNLPASYRSLVRDVPPPKCGTLILEQVRQNFDIFSDGQQALLRRLLVRPDLPLSVVSASRRFRFHYADSGIDAIPLDDLDSNGAPDYLEEVEKAFEKSYDYQVVQLGYLPPPDDGGADGPEFDVYIHNLSGVYGLTTTDGGVPGTTQDDRRTYVEIDNDFLNDYFTPGVPGARVTAAHEYFHAVQFAYRTIQNSNELFYYELCSVWMEDVVYDEINDYYQYLPSFFRRPDISFNRFDPFLHYLGEALWNHFLVKKFNDLNLVRRSWELMRNDVLAIDAVNQSLDEQGSTLTDAFAEFAVWNYFTGGRADPVAFYDESDQYPEVRFKGDFTISADTTISDSSLSLSHKYYKFTTFSAGGYFLTGNVAAGGNWKFAAIVKRPGEAASFQIFDLTDGLNLKFLPQFTDIVVIPINVQVLDGPDLNRLTSTYSTFTFNLIRVPVDQTDEQGIIDIYPNPFIISKHNRINFEFFPKGTQDLEVRILTSGGRIIRTEALTNGSGLLSISSFIWDGTDDRNEPVSSGIYIIQLKQAGFTDVKKFAVVRE